MPEALRQEENDHDENLEQHEDPNAASDEGSDEASAAGAEGDVRASDGGDDGDGHDADPSLSDDERAHIRERRRQERQQKKEFRKAKEEENRHLISALKRQNEELAERLSRMENHSFGAQLSQVDAAMQQAAHQGMAAEQELKAAVEAADGERVVRAQNAMFEARRRFEQLQGVKQQAVQAAQRQQQHIDPGVVNLGQSWMQKHSWYNPAGGDRDSEVALAEDRVMAREGWDPRMPEYWDELSRRLEERLPHRFQRQVPQQSQQQRQAPRAPVSGGSSRDASGSGKTGYTLSPERVAAAKEAGIWDDPVRRKAYIENCRKYDAENGA